jgi:hypothetical protein
VTRAADGAIITDTSRVQINEEIDARFAHGRLRARVVTKS